MGTRDGRLRPPGEYDAACPGGATCGQRIRETRANSAAAGTLLDQAATGWTWG